jgi:DNA-binding MarR family transcriptional regulator
MLEHMPDSVDAHVTRWQAILPDLDADVEGIVKRMSLLVKHLERNKEQGLADHNLHYFEYRTLHALAGRGGKATPTQLATDLDMSPSATTNRLDALDKRGLIRRTHSTEDRRRVDIELTKPGYEAWHAALAVQDKEEHRILATLTPAERTLLADLLRRALQTTQ